MLVGLCGCKLRHNDNVNQNISLSHHLVSLNMVPCNTVCITCVYYTLRVLMCLKHTYISLTDRFWQCSVTHAKGDMC